jgi:N-methylhydantoinase A/oxoprolinase/acetone carboxylase beta subunit
VYREFERASTTSAEAYLRPRVGAYLARTAGEAQRRGIGAVQIMTSSGGALAPGAATARASSLALSGPAGGVVGARLVGEALGIPDLLTLDMGGTSADASIVSGGEALFESAGAVGGVPLGLPAVLIETVSAGGGSIAWNDEGGALKVGPRSAGAVPGPACYGRGGAEPTVTDACLALGWLDPGHPLAAEVQLDRAAAEAALQTLARGTGRDVAGVAAGVVDVATAVMARALKRVSVGRSAGQDRCSPARWPMRWGCGAWSCRRTRACCPRWGSRRARSVSTSSLPGTGAWTAWIGRRSTPPSRPCWSARPGSYRAPLRGVWPIVALPGRATS